MNRETLLKLISQAETRQAELGALIDGAEEVTLIRAYENEMRNLTGNITDYKVALAGMPEDKDVDPNNVQVLEEGRAAGIQAGEFNPLATIPQTNAALDAMRASEDDYFSSVEYRSAFKEFIQNGTPLSEEIRSQVIPMIPEQMRANEFSVSTDVSAIIPTTLMNELIKQASKVYGQIYAKVRKLNVKGGVDFPVGDLIAKFNWITEATPSERQKAGEIKEKISFKYHIGEIRMAQSILTNVVSLDIFEKELALAILNAYAKAMDMAIISGTGSGQPLGITKDTRVKNVVEINETEMADWTTWRKKLFKNVPLSKRGQGEFVFPVSTVEANLLTLKDDNKRPLYIETTNIQAGDANGSFFGRGVTFVEPDIIQDFDTANAGDLVGIYWNPSDYGINSNMQFVIERYKDYDKNQIVDRALVIVDGKILDASGCYLIKKGVGGAGRSISPDNLKLDAVKKEAETAKVEAIRLEKELAAAKEANVKIASDAVKAAEDAKKELEDAKKNQK